MIDSVKTCAFDDQNPGTSGLRRKVVRFSLPHYAENFIQSVFDCSGDIVGKTLVVGGDGRFLNRDIIQKLLKMAAANGFGRVLVGQGGILSTPAVSHLIRKYQAHGGMILSASHNPGGRDGDFGIKYNVAHGGPAGEKVTRAIFVRTKMIDHYKILRHPDIDLDRTGSQSLGGMRVEVIDPVADYADLMAELFDFDQIRRAVAGGLTLRFDAMHAVTGPYACEIFEKRLGFATGSVINTIPREDFGGLHPDPNPTSARDLYDLMMSPQAPDLGCASDGDGDRNMIAGRGIYVCPSDSLAIMAAHACYVKAYAGGLAGVARSMPTARAVDRVARALKVNCHETPTGWKFFTNLMDSGEITLCGEESFGTGSTHLREKDGIWAILFWLNILAVTGRPVSQIVTQHWQQYGRDYCLRHDYEAVDSERAQAMMRALEARLPHLAGVTMDGFTIQQADSFTYHDPIDGSVSSHQGIRILFEEGARLVWRLSGTGTAGATVRLYLERFEADPHRHHLDTQEIMQPIVDIADRLVDWRASLDRPSASFII